jgi:hypothetical protein
MSRLRLSRCWISVRLVVSGICDRWNGSAMEMIDCVKLPGVVQVAVRVYSSLLRLTIPCSFSTQMTERADWASGDRLLEAVLALWM